MRHTFGVALWGSGTGWADSPRMNSRPWDPDLVDFMHWSRNLRGLSDNTCRVRIDLLRRLVEHADKPLRQITADRKSVV